MTIARKRQVHPEATPYYHVISRCVRRAFLCGYDKTTGKDFEHRRQWILDRLELLAQVFAIDIVAYAIMSNHLHLVVRLAREKCTNWNSEEVIERWSHIYGVPPLIEEAKNPNASPAVVEAAHEMTEIRRQRLGDLSWFMKCLNETIARRANREDACTGAFWEGRFKSQALLDEKALLACMAYVDLNPIRAGIAPTPEASEFTSVQQRIRGQESVPLMPFIDQSDENALPLKLAEYLNLVEWSGRIAVPDKRGRIKESMPSILHRVGFEDHSWEASMKLFKNAEIRALGAVQAIKDLAKNLSRRWFRGEGACRAVFGMN